MEQAKEAVKSARFATVKFSISSPPKKLWLIPSIVQSGGNRSGPPNALLVGYNDGAPGGGGMFEVWDRAAVIMQIESRIGADNAAEIAKVEGGMSVFSGENSIINLRDDL